MIGAGFVWVQMPPLDYERGGNSHCLMAGKRELVRVRPIVEAGRIVGWWWRGLGKNTAHRCIQTLDEAKAEARTHAALIFAAAARAGA